MTEQLAIPRIPSGYEFSCALRQEVTVPPELLPWAKEPYRVAVSRCAVQGGESFLLASVIGSSPDLVKAAANLNPGQRRYADNMFYSRLPEFISHKYSPSIETLPSPSTDYPIHVMRSPSGLRLYFARLHFGTPEEAVYGPVVTRLAVCDKNRQGSVMKVLSGLTERASRRRLA